MQSCEDVPDVDQHVATEHLTVLGLGVAVAGGQQGPILGRPAAASSSRLPVSRTRTSVGAVGSLTSMTRTPVAVLEATAGVGAGARDGHGPVGVGQEPDRADAAVPVRLGAAGHVALGARLGVRVARCAQRRRASPARSANASATVVVASPEQRSVSAQKDVSRFFHVVVVIGPLRSLIQ